MRLNLERLEIDPVLETMLPASLNARPHRIKHVRLDALVGVADVFGHQRKQNLARPAPRLAGEQIK